MLNESTRNNLIDHLGVDPSKIFVLGNGVDTSLYRPLVQIDCLRESEILFEKGCRYLFQCGSICPNKGQLRSLKVLAPFMENDKSLCFAYAGGIIDQSYADEIDAFCKSKGIDSQVRYVGELKPGKELASLYGGAIGFLFPSEYEAFAMTLLGLFGLLLKERASSVLIAIVNSGIVLKKSTPSIVLSEMN